MRKYILASIIAVIPGILYVSSHFGFFMWVPEESRHQHYLLKEYYNTPIFEENYQENENTAPEPEDKTSATPVATGEKPGQEIGGPAEAHDSRQRQELKHKIDTKYSNRLNAALAFYEKKLNNLVSSAFSEYVAGLEKGSLAGLAEKYIRAGQVLESECDSIIYGILADYKKELAVHSFPADAVESARKEYERKKAERKATLLDSGYRLIAKQTEDKN